MNKLLIVLFAVCLISVHAHTYVKRDAPATTETDVLADFKNKVSDLTNQLVEAAKGIDTEKIKNDLNIAVDAIKKSVQDMQKPAENKS